MQYQRYSFLQYSSTRPAHIVTPPKEYELVIPVRYHLRWTLGRQKEGQKFRAELNFPFDVALYLTTDKLNKHKNYVALHLPALLGVCYGDRTNQAVATKSGWGAYAAGGISLTRTTGFLGRKAYFSPCSAIGIRKIVGRTLVEFAYTQTYLNEKVAFSENYASYGSTIEDPIKRDSLKYVHHIFSLTFRLKSKNPNS